MKRLLIVCAFFALAGCAGSPRMPVDVAVIPDDCANQQAISRWLTQVIQTPRSQFTNREAYEEHISSVKAKLWTLRYRCNPA